LTKIGVCRIIGMRSSGALKRGIREVVERLTAGFTAVTLPFDLPRTSFNHIFFKSHDRMAVTMWTDKTIFMFLLLNFINRTYWSRHSRGTGLQKYISSCLPLSFKASANFLSSFRSMGKSSPNHNVTLITERMFVIIKYQQCNLT
jgi:hypothetical protein